MFKDVFDVASLDEFQVGHLQYILTSPSYEDVFRPYLERVRNSLASKILDPAETRKDEYPDDFLRGGILMIDGLLHLFTRLIEETEVERIERTQREMSEKQQYDILRGSGVMRPMSGIADKDYDLKEDY